MHAELIAVGSELTAGASLDTNSQWLSRRLADAGIAVSRHTTVADDLDDMVAVFREAAARSDVLIITGGLGPTLDDLTRQALAALAGVELRLHEPSLAWLREFFARRRRDMPERNVIQAMFPEGSEPIPNARGTAPGIWLEYRPSGRDMPCRIATLPGVPSEMKPMFETLVLPRLPGSGRTIVRHEVHCFGAGESAIEAALGDLTARGRDPEVGITAHEATITLRIAAHAATPEDSRAKVVSTQALIRERLGRLVFAEQGERLEHVVTGMLAARGATLATAEGGTGGLLAQWLTDARTARPSLSAAAADSGGSGGGGCRSVAARREVFLGGVVVPVATAPRLLPLAAQVARGEGLQGREAAIAMATACRGQFGSDFAMAVSDWVEPNPDHPQSEMETAWVALAGADGVTAEELPLLGDPAISRSRVAKAALNLLRLHLLAAPG